MTRQSNDVRAPGKMTMRVSRDNGHTWGPITHVAVAKEVKGDQTVSSFPPCGCARRVESRGTECATQARPLAVLPGGCA